MASEAAHVAEGMSDQNLCTSGCHTCWSTLWSMSKHVCADLEHFCTSHVHAVGQSHWSVPQRAQPGNCTGVSCGADGETTSDVRESRLSTACYQRCSAAQLAKPAFHTTALLQVNPAAAQAIAQGAAQAGIPAVPTSGTAPGGAPAAVLPVAVAPVAPTIVAPRPMAIVAPRPTAVTAPGPTAIASGGRRLLLAA